MAYVAPKCYTYDNGKDFYYSVRSGNDSSNSLESGRYDSRGGRNWRVRTKVKKAYMNVIIIQGRPPKKRKK